MKMSIFENKLTLNLTYVIFWSKGVNHVYGIHFRRNDKEMIGSILKIGQSLKDSTKKTKI